MDKEDIQEFIRPFTENENLEYKIYVLLKDNTLRLLNIDQEDLELLGLEYSDLLSNKTLTEEYALMNYSVADNRSDCYYIYDLQEYPASLAPLMAMPNEDDIEDFDLSNNSLQDIRATMAVLFDGENTVRMLKYFYSIEVIAAKKSFYLWSMNDRFTRCDQDLLKITPGVDLLFANGHLIILNSKQFEKNEQLTKIIENEAVRNIENLRRVNLVGNMDEIETLIKSDTKIAKKFIQAVSTSRVLFTGVPIPNIIAFARRKESKIGKLTYTDDGRQITPKSKREIMTMLTLLNNDLLMSELTHDDYIAPAKDLL